MIKGGGGDGNAVCTRTTFLDSCSRVRLRLVDLEAQGGRRANVRARVRGCAGTRVRECTLISLSECSQQRECRGKSCKAGAGRCARFVFRQIVFASVGSFAGTRLRGPTISASGLASGIRLGIWHLALPHKDGNKLQLQQSRLHFPIDNCGGLLRESSRKILLVDYRRAVDFHECSAPLQLAHLLRYD